VRGLDAALGGILNAWPPSISPFAVGTIDDTQSDTRLTPKLNCAKRRRGVIWHGERTSTPQKESQTNWEAHGQPSGFGGIVDSRLLFFRTVVCAAGAAANSGVMCSSGGLRDRGGIDNQLKLATDDEGRIPRAHPPADRQQKNTKVLKKVNEEGEFTARSRNRLSASQ